MTSTSEEQIFWHWQFYFIWLKPVTQRISILKQKAGLLYWIFSCSAKSFRSCIPLQDHFWRKLCSIICNIFHSLHSSALTQYWLALPLFSCNSVWLKGNMPIVKQPYVQFRIPNLSQLVFLWYKTGKKPGNSSMQPQIKIAWKFPRPIWVQKSCIYCHCLCAKNQNVLK